MTAQAAIDVNLRSALNDATGRLAEAGVDTARLDAELLMAQALGLAREEIFLSPDRQLSVREMAAFEALVSRRAAREPVARITGTKEFWSLQFALNAATLVPRPDSETLVAAVLQEIGEAAGGPLRILDLGTGSGCLLLALLSEMPGATGIGVDCDPEAVVVARQNARRLGLQERAEFRDGDWFGALEADAQSPRFDVIISNPPYIETGEIAGLAPEVASFEPRAALDGGADGLEAYRRIATSAQKYLASDGQIFLELGAGQEKAVSKILEHHGLGVRGQYKDLAGVLRVISASVAAEPVAEMLQKTGAVAGLPGNE